TIRAGGKRGFNPQFHPSGASERNCLLWSIHDNNLSPRRGATRNPSYRVAGRWSPLDRLHRGAPLPDPGPLHAGAGGVRNRAMSMRISLNICPDTATSAIWNATWRPWLTTLAPILIGFSRRLVSDRGSAPW